MKTRIWKTRISFSLQGHQDGRCHRVRSGNCRSAQGTTHLPRLALQQRGLSRVDWLRPPACAPLCAARRGASAIPAAPTRRPAGSARGGARRHRRDRDPGESASAVMASMPPGRRPRWRCRTGCRRRGRQGRENPTAMLKPDVVDAVESGGRGQGIAHSMLRKRSPMKQPMITKPKAETAGGTCPTTVPEPASRPLASIAPISVGAVTRSLCRAAPPTREADISTAKASGVSRAGAELLFTHDNRLERGDDAGQHHDEDEEPDDLHNDDARNVGPLVGGDDQHRRQRTRESMRRTRPAAPTRRSWSARPWTRPSGRACRGRAVRG